MLFPFTRVWTRRQKRFIVGFAVVALASFGALIYGYERYYRGPSETVLCGKWQFDGLFYVEFSHNHSFSMFELDEPHSLIVKGCWHAGGKFLYMRFPASFRPNGNILEIWRIEDISAEEVRVRYCQDCMTHVFQRVDSATARTSNHAAVAHFILVRW